MAAAGFHYFRYDFRLLLFDFFDAAATAVIAADAFAADFVRYALADRPRY